MIVASWDTLRELLNAELQQRAYEGALVPSSLRERIATLTESDMNEERIRPLFGALAALDVDPDFPYVQPNDLAGIRRERPEGPRHLAMELSDDALLDRFHGAWSGRASGCALGKPVELLGLVGADGLNGRQAIRSYLEKRNDWPLSDYFSGRDAGDGVQLVFPASQREHIAYMEPDDDIHYTLIALHVLESTGPGFAWYDVAEAWNDCIPYAAIFTAEGQAILNYNIATPRAQPMFGGEPIRPEPEWTRTNSNPYREWIGAQIRADGWGYACAGNPELAAELAWRDASWTHTANGIYAAMFNAAMVAAAFVESDPIRLAEIGLSEIPRTCRLAEAVADAFSWFPECPTADDFMERLEARFDDLNPVHAVNNALVVLMALVYGAMDAHRSICLAVTAGLDTDCNGATTGSIVGATAGRERFDSRLLAPLHDTIRPRMLGFHETTMHDLAVRQLGVYRTVQAYARRRA
jgi:ADP-ribosylglycohydrolase